MKGENKMYVRLKKIVCTNEYNCKVSGREEYDCGRGQQPHCLGNILLLCCILLSPFRPVGNVEIMCSFALHLLFCLSFSLKVGDEREKNYISKLCAWFP